MLISEIYNSTQGEGFLTGKPSVFVRTCGCNLRCGFCDTPFTSWEPSGYEISVSDIVARVVQFANHHVVITGGEPMLPREIVELTHAIKGLDRHITIETAGTLFRDVECDLMSISPKLSNSTPDSAKAGKWRDKHESSRYRPDVLNQLIQRYDYQLKFVVGSPDDVEEVERYLDSLKGWNHDRVLLMPEGVEQEQLIERQAWLQPVCANLGFQFCPRMHIQWFGNRRGT